MQDAISEKEKSISDIDIEHFEKLIPSTVLGTLDSKVNKEIDIMLEEQPRNTMMQKIFDDRECIIAFKEICLHVLKEITESKIRVTGENLPTMTVNI